ncbi:MAG: RluA family pseudouridine synthase [Puniceicoccaceae bacterium]
MRVEFRVDEAEGDTRLDRFLAGKIPAVSRTKIQQWIQAGLVRVNGKEATTGGRLTGGDRVEVNRPETPRNPPGPMAKDLGVEVIYEDDALLVVNKRPGLVVHAGSGTDDETLVNGLLYLSGGRLGIGDDPERPGIVHRLDKETSGVLVAAKTTEALRNLQTQFKARETRKFYNAWVQGRPKARAGTIDAPIGRHPVHRMKMALREDGRGARTDWEVEVERESGGERSLLKCRIHTGRTHQIRVHLSSLGHPILGDQLYGFRPRSFVGLLPPRVMLHASSLTLTHPSSGEMMTFTTPLPEDFNAYF